jgi:S1-C subfamily serine protease
MLSAAGAEKNLVHAVAGSIAPTRQAPLALPEEGRLARLVARFLDIAEEKPRKSRDSEPPVPPDTSREGLGVTSASGSGFVITRDGDVLTNAHVVDGCRRIEVDGTPGSIVAESEIFDLAILNARDLRDRVPAQFASQPAGLNADVTTAGYPLSDILDGLNVTRGSVSALKGLRGDAFNMQITAPVQPGSSGGPVFDRFGHVVGVVVARLDTRLAEERTGAMPENVNFAVRGEAAKLFLAQQGVQIEIVSGTAVLPPEDLGRRAQQVTVRVTCLE